MAITIGKSKNEGLRREITCFSLSGEGINQTPANIEARCPEWVLSANHKPIISGMELEAIVQAIDGEIERLAKVRALLTGHTAPLKRGLPRTTQPLAAPARWKMSAEGRANIIAAQKARRAREKAQP